MTPIDNLITNGFDKNRTSRIVNFKNWSILTYKVPIDNAQPNAVYLIHSITKVVEEENPAREDREKTPAMEPFCFWKQNTTDIR